MPLSIVLISMIYLKHSVISKWIRTKQVLANGRIHKAHTPRRNYGVDYGDEVTSLTSHNSNVKMQDFNLSDRIISMVLIFLLKLINLSELF